MLEEDRFIQEARCVLASPTHDLVSAVAAALRAERERTKEEAAQIAEGYVPGYTWIAAAIRALR